VREAFLDYIANHRVDVPVNKFRVFEFTNCMLDHVALSVYEVTNLVNYGLVEQGREYFGLRILAGSRQLLSLSLMGCCH
jgi:hypothetical protein